MAIVTYPVNGVSFDAEDVETYMCTRTSGVYAGDMDYTVVATGNGNNVSVGDGLAWMRISRFGGKSVASKTPVILDAGLPDPRLPRIDAVVLQWSANKNGCELIIKKGVASSAPKPPEVVRNTNIYELHLCHIRRRVGATMLTPEDLTDLREDEKYCGIMYNDVTLKGMLDVLTKKDLGKTVAPLEGGKVPGSYLPEMDYIPTSKEATFATLVNGKVPIDQLKTTSSIENSSLKLATASSVFFVNSKIPGSSSLKKINSKVLSGASSCEILEYDYGRLRFLYFEVEPTSNIISIQTTDNLFFVPTGFENHYIPLILTYGTGADFPNGSLYGSWNSTSYDIHMRINVIGSNQRNIIGLAIVPMN